MMLHRFCALTIAASFWLLGSSLKAEEPYEAWLKFYKGDWKWTATDGGSGEILFTRVAKDVPALAVHFKRNHPNAASAISVLGWNREEKALIDHGYNSSGAHGHIKYTNITPDKMDGVWTSKSPDGKTSSSKFVVTRIDDNEYRIVISERVKEDKAAEPFTITVARK